MVLGTRSLVVRNDIIPEIFRHTNNTGATLRGGGPKGGVTPLEGLLGQKVRILSYPEKACACPGIMCSLRASLGPRGMGSTPRGVSMSRNI